MKISRTIQPRRTNAKHFGDEQDNSPDDLRVHSHRNAALGSDHGQNEPPETFGMRPKQSTRKALEKLMVPCPVEHPSSTSHRIDFQFFSTDSYLPCNSDVHEAKLLCGIRCICRETRLSVEKDELKHHGVATLQHQTFVSGIVLCSTKHSSAQSCFATPNIHNGQRAMQHRSKLIGTH